MARTLPYWYDAVVPRLAAGEQVLVAAHGNSLRALVKHLDGISDADIPELNIPTGIPLVYTLDTAFPSRLERVPRRSRGREEGRRGHREAGQGVAKPDHEVVARVK